MNYTLTFDDKTFTAQIDIQAIKDDLFRSIDYEDLNPTDIPVSEYNEMSTTRCLTSQVEGKTIKNFKDELVKDIEAIEEDVQTFLYKLLKDIGKKKDGYLRKNAVAYGLIADGFGWDWPESYCTAYPSIAAKAVDARTFIVEQRYYKDKY